MGKSHYSIPIFIPEAACPNKCVYCNQSKITGVKSQPSPDEVERFIRLRLNELPEKQKSVEIAFFGGNFTGLDLKLQQLYLEKARIFISDNQVSSIRISTRPDYIDDSKLSFLKEYHVQNIELGAQSMCNDVLIMSGRGHTSEDTIHASGLIKNFGFRLGLQMMIGLPYDTPEKTLFTANEIVRIGAEETRLYPLLVFKDTPLFELYIKGGYSPLTVDDAIGQLSPIVKLFEDAGVKILRVGLHPSKDMHNGAMVAGPWHPALRQMVYTRIWDNILNDIIEKSNGKRVEIKVSSNQFPNAIGYERRNAMKYKQIVFVSDSSFQGMHYEVHHCK